MPGTEVFGPEERKEVNDVMDTGIMFRYNHDHERQGNWKARTFEKELAEYVGAKYAHSVSSGSTAVATAMAACGIGFGDEVIVPPYTYIATIEGVLLGGAVPIFAEIDETLCLSPEGIEAVITPKTKAVALVHMCGAIGRLDEIIAVCEKHNLILLEDSAQALGASYKGKMAGTIGKIGCYSFDFFKIITCGEGGGIVTNDEELYKKADNYSDHGHDHIGNARGMENHPFIGFNYRISELHAAVGVAQLRKIHTILEKQRANKKVLKDFLRQFPEITFRHIPDEAGDSATFLCFYLPDANQAKAVYTALGSEAIGGLSYWWENMYHYIRNWDHLKNMQTMAKLPVEVLENTQNYKTLELPKSDAIISRMVSIQIRVMWTPEQLQELTQKIGRALKSVFEKQTA